MAHQIRPIRMDDAADISALLDWAWFAPRSEAGWRWLCRAPRSQAARSLPAGYVVEDDSGRVGGVFGLFAQDYVSAHGDVVGATAHTLIVHPRLKGASHPLIDTVLDQPALFGISVLNGNARAAPIYARHGFEPCPVGASDLTLTWVTDPLAVLAERAAKAVIARAGEAAKRPAERFMRARVFETELVRLGPVVVPITPSSHGGELDAFWSALASEGRLTARRDAVFFAWRFADPDRTRDPILLAWMDGQAIGGLLLAQVSKINEVECPSLDIIDLVARAECAEAAFPDLTNALLRNAARLGVARVRMSVVTQETEDLVGGTPGVLRRRGHIHGHLNLRPSARELAQTWRLTSFDADYGYCLRHPPKPSALARAA